MAYYDTESYGTEDALKIGRLHCMVDGWQESIVRWMQSGGYTVRPLIPDVRRATARPRAVATAQCLERSVTPKGVSAAGDHKDTSSVGQRGPDRGARDGRALPRGHARRARGVH
eukprot:scaffold156_cov308-Prasinococcus_capsulatus_cf.AAC.26